MAEQKIESPMTGNVIEISVSVGDTVEIGDMLIVIESMKMENEIFSEVSGTITAIHVSEDDNVSEEDVLMSIDVN
ncbi:MAG: biotin/lipoyl-binding protein [SAR202 cluster bacterium]|nr:biotin/lipoyl-binding protein [SAR202 cluster bacterium]|tara:strand:+ start:1445 stop:1669 length:225 start_codon:yes stop_codon:yes gene_type:complete